MKKFLSLFAVAAIAFAYSATAQPAGTYTAGNGTTSLNGGTNVLAGSTATVYNYSFGVAEYDNVGVTISSVASGANTTNYAVRIARSKDGGTTYETQPSITLYVTNTGTTPVIATYNIATPTDTHLKVIDIANTNTATYITNISFKWRLKYPKYGAVTSVSK